MTSVVGRRVRVFWEGEGEWFEGVVVEVSSESGYFIKYDDGEEQWEQPGDGLLLLPSDPSDSICSYDEDTEMDAQAVAASPSYSQQEFEHEDKTEDDGVTANHDEEFGSPPQHKQYASKAVPETSVPEPTRQETGSHSGARPGPAPRALRGGSAPFFRDKETLQEMKRTLDNEKRELIHVHATLKRQHEDRQRESSELKRELTQLKAQVSVASALYFSVSNESSAATKPATAIHWKQKVLDMKLDNEQLQHEIVVLKTACQEQKRRVSETTERVEKLRATIERVPKRELLTLGDLQVEIAQLLQQKRDLEATVAKSARTTTKANALKTRQMNDNDSDGVTSRTEIEKQLSSLEISVTQSQEETRTWKIRLECERAKLQPMRERLTSLRSELLRFHSGEKGKRSVLLRSLFLRLDRDGDGLVDRGAALESFELLLGSRSPNAAKQVGDSEVGMTFEQFADAFQAFASEAT